MIQLMFAVKTGIDCRDEEINIDNAVYEDYANLKSIPGRYTIYTIPDLINKQ